MAIIKEKIITIIEELPDEATLEEIEMAIIVKTLPPALLQTKKVEKQIEKIDKLNRELCDIIKKCEMNPRYLQETIPLSKARNSFNVERNFHVR